MSSRISFLSRGIVATLTLVAVAGFAIAQQSILDDPARSAEERERDAGSKPLEVYAFWGIEPGMTVVDLMPGRGYNTFILSRLVGDSGMVYAGPDRGDRLAEALAARPLDNVHPIGSPGEIPAGSVDAMITVRNLHDLGDRAPAFLADCLAALKPGGVLGVVDARTNMAGYDDSTHRLNQDHAIEIVTAAGFEFVESSELLANPDDDFGSWEGASGRTATDRMVLKFRKPGM